ncbi:MAG: glycoside hydrolase family 43 protein, partial [Bacteroidota bacterium]
MKKKFVLILLLVFAGLSAQQKTFNNPLLPSGADPYSTYHNGYYYYTQTLGNRIDIWRTKSIALINTAERKTVWTPPPSGPYSKNVWAPEIHFLAGKWYIYFAADSGRNSDHRLWVLENSAADPLQGEWIMKGKLVTPDDKWSIDGSVFEYKNQFFLIWSGWEGNVNQQQNIYIAEMKNPWTVGNKRTLVSA